nr:putative uncharacterized protein C3orf49 [Pogona vitticeps]
MTTNSVKKNTRMPEGSFPTNSGFLEYSLGKKESLMKRFRITLKKMFPVYQKASKKAKGHNNRSSKAPTPSAGPAVPNKHHVLPKTNWELSLPKVFPKLKRQKVSQNASILLDVNIVEERAHSVSGENAVMEARQMTRRISVVSLPPGIKKVSYLAKKKNFPLFKKKKSMPAAWYHSDLTLGKLQMEIDNLLDNISEKSIQLLALRSAELQHCESLGDKILQASKQFQKVSIRTPKKHKPKKNCFPCKCCC